VKYIGYKVTAWVIALVLVYGFIAPAMVSAASTTVVILGIVLMCVTLWQFLRFLNKLS
jgi:hypothetical protein